MAMNEETHHKMSKKIAQLTKVIFHLHSKNEENSNMQKAIENAYEKEIETLLSNANSVITRQKEQITKAQEGSNWRDKIRQLESEHVSEREASQRQFQDYRVALQSKEQKLEEDHKARIADMKS